MPAEVSFPEAVTYKPASGTHKQTIILLHGRGGSADTFGHALLSTPLARDSPTTLAQAFLHAKFVFPNARKQRATVYRRSTMRQWFDDWHLGFVGGEVDSSYDTGLQTAGLGSTVAYLHRLVADEAGLVGGAQNLVLGGISQGSAASLVASLLWEGGEPLGGIVGMCGWLPYMRQMRAALVGGACDGIQAPDPFDRSASPGCDVSAGGFDAGDPVQVALDWLRDELDMPRTQVAASSTPRRGVSAILCHGQDDEQVNISKGSESAEFLATLDVGPIVFKEYADVEHGFSAEMLSDIAAFLRNVFGDLSKQVPK